MQISNAEKLIVHMLCDIYDKLEIDPDGNNLNHKFIEKAIVTDNSWAINWKYGDGLAFSKEDTPQTAKDVVEILDMWRVLEAKLGELDVDLKNELVTKLDSNDIPEFDGFHGNREFDHISAAEFLIEDMERFTEFKGRIKEAYTEMAPSYLAMLEVFTRIQKSVPMNNFTIDDLAQIFNAK